MSRAHISGIALVLAVVFADFNGFAASHLCPTRFLGTHVGSDGVTRYCFGGKKCPEDVMGTATDTVNHILGTSCANCGEKIVLPAIISEESIKKPLKASQVQTEAVSESTVDGLGYVAPRSHDPGSAPPGRRHPLAPAPGIKIVKDFELVVRRGSKDHHFRILGMRSTEPISKVFYIGFELAADDPDRETTREPVRGRLKDLGSNGPSHVVIFNGEEYDVLSAESWN